jgi:hypothetical protein
MGTHGLLSYALGVALRLTTIQVDHDIFLVG